jgi:ankyrin repeat protein
LIRRHINVNQQDNDGMTPLHYAAVYSNHSLAEKIVNAGGSLKIVDKHGNGPLWTAVFNARGSYSIVDLFLRRGADPHHKNNHGLSPLDFAKRIEDSVLMQRLLVGP